MNFKLHNFIKNYAMPIGLLLIIILLQLFNQNVPVLSLLNIKNILLQSVSIALTALGLSYIMMCGEGDISFAGVFSLLTIIFTLTANRTSSIVFAFCIALIASFLIYYILAKLVTRLKLSSFIISIAFMFMASGLEKALHQRTTLVKEESVSSFAAIECGIPLIVIIMLACYIISYILIKHTHLGFKLRIVGENKDAGIEAGINIKRVKLIAYMFAAVCITLAATVESTRVGAIYQQGMQYMLPIFAACFLGSSMFVSGHINILGTFVGALFLAIINNFMNMLNVDSYIIPMVQGGILIIAVGLVSFRNRDKIQQVKV